MARIDKEKASGLVLMPNDSKAEAAVLGAILRDNTVMDDVCKLVSAGSFYSHSHQLYFHCFQTIITKRRIPADPVTLCDMIHENGWTEDTGGAAYIVELWNAAPSISNVAEYAEIVRGCAIRRALARMGHDIEQKAMAPGADWKGLLEESERTLFALSNKTRSAHAHPFSKDIDLMLDRMDEKKKKGDDGLLKTGLTAVDAVTGGLDEGNVIIIGARVGVGKTVVAINLAMNLAEAGVGVLIVSLEQPGVELAQRVIASRSRVQAWQIRQCKIDPVDESNFLDAVQAVKGLPVWLSDEPRQTIYDISATIRQFVAKHAVKAVFIDYLQLVTPEDRKLPRHEQVAEITRQMKLIARETGARVFVLAQINRESEKGADKKPQLHHLRESGSIESDADVVFLLYMEEDKPSELQILIPKNRHGIAGVARVHFDKAHLRILDRV